jgi:hypothetical protein
MAHLLDLPCELRDMIYHYAWLHGSIIGANRDNSCFFIFVEYTPDPPDNTRPTSLCKVSSANPRARESMG